MTEDGWKKTHLSAMRVRPPWSPTDEDIAFVEELALPVLRARPHASVLVLGVTPRLVQMNWPPGTEIIAVDSSPGMIESTWQPHTTLLSRAICAPWQDIPVDYGSIDVVAGDGSLNSLPVLYDFPRVFREVRRVIGHEGAFVLRSFLRPDAVETPDQIVANARAGAFPTTAAFRFRFCLALAGKDGSVALSDLHATFNALVSDRDELARATGWPRADIDRVDVDKDSKVRFAFPTLGELEELCRPHFIIEQTRHGPYTQSEQCPTVLFRPV